MSAHPQPHPDSEDFSKLINACLQDGSTFHGRPVLAAHYTAAGDAQQIINNGTIEIGKLENHYYGSDASNNRSERSPMAKWLIENDDNVRQQIDIFNKAWASREPGSGSWLLKNDIFKEWLAGRSQTLWLHGGVGCGKTVLSTFIVQNLRQACRYSTSQRVLHYYCSFRYSSGQEFSFLLRMLLAQICAQNTPSAARNFYNECRVNNPWPLYGMEVGSPPVEQLKSVIRASLIEYHQALRHDLLLAEPKIHESALKQHSCIYLIVDGLDELAIAQLYPALVFMQQLKSLEFLQLLGTSRTQPNIEKKLVEKASWPAIMVDKAAVRHDIELHISNTIDSSELADLGADLQQEIKNTLLTNGEGMFLWVSLQLRHLQSLMVQHPATIRTELKTLPEDLHDTYTRILNRIASSLRPKSMRALRLLALTRRSLSMDELVEACSLHESLLKVPHLIERHPFGPDDINRLLSDLLYLDPPLSIAPSHKCTVTLAHASVQDFLVGNDAISQESNAKKPLLAMGHEGDVRKADIYLGETCLAFLFSYNKPGVRKEDHPFLPYAWFHWDEHLQPQTQQIEARGQNYFRAQAPDIYKQITTDYKHNLHWLPKENEARLLDALDVPYFYPNLGEFQLSDSRFRPTNMRHADRSGQHLWRDTVSEDSYIYQQLHHQNLEIRLLEILPGLSTNTPTTCRLSAFPIKNAPTFDAVSYVWGASTDAHSVFVNGMEIPLRENLARILGNLRHRSETEDGHLWVDAISVNQTDNLERNHQAAIMAKIFSSARRVLISLGAADDGDAEGVANVKTATKRFPHADANELAALRTFVLDPENCITQLFQKPYWSRVWIIQEVVLAKDLTILFGNHSLGLKHLEACFSLLQTTDETGTVRKRFAYRSSPGLDNMLAIMQTRREFRDRGGCDYLDILLRFKHHYASHPADKIFGFMGLTVYNGPAILIDYSQPVGEIYLRATIAIMLHDRNLRVLSYHPVRYLQNGPSWSMQYEMHQQEPVSLLDAAPNYTGVYNAGGELFEVEPPLGDGPLKLKGITVAKLVRKLVTPLADLHPAEGERRIRLVYTAQMQFDSPTTEDAPSRTEISWRTLLAAQSQLGKRLHSFMLGNPVVPPVTLEQAVNPIYAWPDTLRTEHFWGRALFVAQAVDSKMLLLLGPENAEVGDVAVVLFGGAVPFVLRQSGTPEEHTLLGECYIHDFMNGEALNHPGMYAQTFHIV